MVSERVILLGVNHKTTPVEVREKMALTDGYEESLQRLGRIEGCKEYYLLSTCNRVELLLVAEPTAELEEEIVRFLFGDRIPKEKCSEYLYMYYDDEAVLHMFMVAASLDSMIVGEAQILGQLKEAYRFATAQKCTGSLLNKLLHKSFSVAKRVRCETGIGSSAVSISYAAVQLAKKIFGSIAGKKVMLVGAGEMAELAAEHLLGQGVEEVVVVNRTLSKAVDLAKRFDGTAASLDELHLQLERVDIIISSTGAKGFILTKEEVRPIMRARRNSPLFFIDIAVPRDLDPVLSDLENVYLYDIDDLQHIVEKNKSERDKEAVKAKRIVEEESLKFSKWREGMAMTPTIMSLRRKADRIAKDEFAKTAKRLNGLSAKEQKMVEKMGQAICSKLIHDPLQYLKSESCSHGNKEQKIEFMRSVFGLDQEKDE